MILSGPHLPLKQAMARHRVTQAALAAWCGTTQATISRMLNGHTKPSGKVIAGAMSLFGATQPGHLFDGIQARR